MLPWPRFISSWPAVTATLVLLGAGCDGGSITIVPSDAAIADVAPLVEFASPSDLAPVPPPDLHPLPDLSAPADLSAPLDLAPPPDLAAVITQSIGMRVLLLTAHEAGDPNTDGGIGAARLALQAFGIPYDELPLVKGRARVSELPLVLTEQNGDPRYYGVVVTSRNLEFRQGNGMTTSALNPAQWQQVSDYETKYHVRHVSLDSLPANDLGVLADGPTVKGAANGARLAVIAEGQKWASGLVPGATMSLENTDLSPVRITAPMTTSAVFAFRPPGGNGNNDQIGAVVARRAGHDELHLFFVSATYVPASVAFATVWVQWVTRGLYQGQRRVNLSAQIDDLFLASYLWDPQTETNPMNQQHVYRITPQDMVNLGAAQRQASALLPKGSTFTAEWGWNGAGRAQFADKNGVDALYDRAKAMAGDFYWESHTWDHRLLDNTTYRESSDEVVLNQQQVPDLLGVQATARFSARSMITPGISGLFNGNALRALHDNGVENVVGDDSIAALKAPVVNQGLFTTMGQNGYAGIFIVPRYGLDIDFDASLPIECESKYNKKNRQRLMRNVTFGEVLDLNADRTARRLLAYRRDPYMFHQANVRSFQWPGGHGIAAGTHSLLSLWLHAVALRIGAVSTLPVVTWSHDEMALRYRAENDRAACGVDGRLQLDVNWNVVSIRMAAHKSCLVPVTGLDDPGSGTVERYGPDVTTSVKVDPMARRLLLPVPLVWL